MVAETHRLPGDNGLNSDDRTGDGYGRSANVKRMEKMIIRNATIFTNADTEIQMSVDEQANFTGNKVYSSPSPVGEEMWNAAVEACARWHDERAEIVMNSLHCGDNTSAIGRARRVSDFHHASAVAVRALKRQSGEG